MMSGISTEAAMKPDPREKESIPDKASDLRESCPVEEAGCPLIEELNRLRRECKRLQELSDQDPLTQLFNFRYLMAALSREMERTRRSGLSIGLLIFDLDHFKRFNDTFGHEAGNKVLKRVSKVTLQNIRQIDIPCRFGGEEFTVILPATRLVHAVQAAERLRKSLEDNPVEIDGRMIPVTASFGVDVYSGRKRLSANQFIKRTDRFLMDAKKHGRNCVLYDEEKARVIPTKVTGEERRALYRKEPGDD
jgi:two-component system cell cycle response regulator